MASTAEPPVIGGPRWYRVRLLVGGPVVALIPPAALGIVALVVLWAGSGRMSALIGLLAGVTAAPGLLAVGAPIAEQSTYPAAIIASAVFWAVLGLIAAWRATRRPVATWRDFWAAYAWLAVAVVVGAGIGIAVAAARLGESLL
jgi:hypothetical protein